MLGIIQMNHRRIMHCLFMLIALQLLVCSAYGQDDSVLKNGTQGLTLEKVQAKIERLMARPTKTKVYLYA